MKFIEKSIEDEKTGAVVSFHEITSISIDYVNNYISVIIGSYISKESKESGKHVLSHSSIFVSDAFPESRKVCIHDWILNELVKDKTKSLENEMPNRYMLAGGIVKDTETA